jgi:hypothetical protein
MACVSEESRYARAKEAVTRTTKYNVMESVRWSEQTCVRILSAHFIVMGFSAALRMTDYFLSTSAPLNISQTLDEAPS